MTELEDRPGAQQVPTRRSSAHGCEGPRLCHVPCVPPRQSQGGTRTQAQPPAGRAAEAQVPHWSTGRTGGHSQQGGLAGGEATHQVTSTRQLCQAHGLFVFSFLVFIFILREKQSTGGGRAGKEGDTEPEAGSRLQAVSTQPDMGLKLMNREIMT